MTKKERALMIELKQRLHELYNKAEEAFLSFDGAKPMEAREVMKDCAALALIVETLTWKEGDKTADFVLQAAADEYNAEMNKSAPVISETDRDAMDAENATYEAGVAEWIAQGRPAGHPFEVKEYAGSSEEIPF